ncbi:hypothetical protein ABK040_010231 [Willaertia magna]
MLNFFKQEQSLEAILSFNNEHSPCHIANNINYQGLISLIKEHFPLIVGDFRVYYNYNLNNKPFVVNIDNDARMKHMIDFFLQNTKLLTPILYIEQQKQLNNELYLKNTKKTINIIKELEEKGYYNFQTIEEDKIFSCFKNNEILIVKILNSDYVGELAINELIKGGPHLVKVKCYHPFKDGICIVMKYYQHGDLGSLLERKDLFISEYALKKILFQLCLALDHLHILSIIHGDMQIENILIENINETFNNSIEMNEVIDIDIVLSDVGEANRTLDIHEGNSDIEQVGAILYSLMTKDAGMTGEDSDFINLYSNDFKYLIKRMINENYDKKLTAAQILKLAIYNNWILDEDNEMNQLKKNTIYPSEIIYFIQDRICISIPSEYCNILDLYRLYCNAQLENENNIYENRYLYNIFLIHVDELNKEKYLGIQLSKLFYKNTNKEVDNINENIICQVEVTHNSSYIKSICNGNFTFIPNLQNNELTNLNTTTTTTVNQGTTVLPSNNYFTNAYFTRYDNIEYNNNDNNNNNMNYYEYQYLLKNADLNFEKLIKYNKCPLGFPILSHYVARGLKDKCEILIRNLFKNPNEMDCLGKTAYDWADYYKTNGLDRNWLIECCKKYNMLDFIEKNNLQNEKITELDESLVNCET